MDLTRRDFVAAVARGGYFPLTNCSTIVVTNTLTISNPVILDGGPNRATITGNGLLRLFTVQPGASLTRIAYSATHEVGNARAAIDPREACGDTVAFLHPGDRGDGLPDAPQPLRPAALPGKTRGRLNETGA